MLDMKSASVRDVQHHLSKVLAWVEKGEEVQITRRNKTVAKIVPAEAQGTRIALPAFAARARQIWGETPVGKSLSQTVVDDRKERAWDTWTPVRSSPFIIPKQKPRSWKRISAGASHVFLLRGSTSWSW
jgi:prevent-host-death family protein